MPPDHAPRLQISYQPVLHTLRDLYLQPRDRRRFKAYLAALTGGTQDVVLPISLANPMAKEQALASIETLLDMDADTVAAAAAAQAAERLASSGLDVSITATLVLVDDVGGGWTNRYTTEASVRFPGRGALKRPFAFALCWTSERPTTDALAAEVLAEQDPLRALR